MEDGFSIVECPKCERNIRYPKELQGLIRCKECLHQFSTQFEKVNIVNGTSQEEQKSSISTIPLFVNKNKNPKEDITNGLRILFITWVIMLLIAVMISAISFIPDEDTIPPEDEIVFSDIQTENDKDNEDIILEFILNPMLWFSIFAFIHAYSFGIILSGVKELFNQK